MSSETNPINMTAIASATSQANRFGSTLTTLTVLTALIWLGWGVAVKVLGVDAPPVGLPRLLVFLTGLWFVYGALTALINHTLVTFYRVGVETVAITATGIAEAMKQAQATAEAEASVGVAPTVASSPITYLHDALLRRAQDADKQDR